MSENLSFVCNHLCTVLSLFFFFFLFVRATNLHEQAIQKLQDIARQTASGSTQLIAAAQGAAASNRNAASQQQLVDHSKEVANSVGLLVQAIRFVKTNPDGPSAQLGLIHSCKQLSLPATKVCVSVSKMFELCLETSNCAECPAFFLTIKQLSN